MNIKSENRQWKEAHGNFVWPEGVTVVFPNGDEYDRFGARNRDGDSIDYNPEGTGSIGSPCHQALVETGIIEA